MQWLHTLAKEGTAIKVTLQSQTWKIHGKPNDETNQVAAIAIQGKNEGRSTLGGAAEIRGKQLKDSIEQGRFGNVLDLGRREWINSRVFYSSPREREKQS